MLLFILCTIFISCDTEDPFSFPPPDLTTVPDGYDTSGIEPEVIADGVTIYVHDEGGGPFYVTSIDEVLVYITLRASNDDIIYSSFANGNESPVPVNMLDAGDIQNLSQLSSFSALFAYAQGLEKGLMKMKEGERRTIVVEPEQGFRDVPEGHPNESYKESTLIYDILVYQIDPG